MSYTILGKCSRCGGTVSVPVIWYGVVPPTPTCNGCGATKSNEDLPTIKMEPRK